MKKILSLVAALSLVVSLAVGGSIAYLQDTESTVNVMTLGNVDITVHEYERELDENGEYKTATIDNQNSYVLKEFTQAKPLLPIVGDPSEPGDSPAYKGYDDKATVRMSQVDSYGGMKVFAGKNAQDKFVTVENNGKSDAFVRTYIAFEVGSADPALLSYNAFFKSSETDIAPWVKNELGSIEINGNTYFVHEFVYEGVNTADVVRHANGVLPAGETTYPNLAQVYLKHTATNEDMVKLDGNGDGAMNILVLSQAVQAAGFDATAEKTAAQNALDIAFGEATAENIKKWFGEEVEMPNVVDTVEEMQEALINGGKVVLGGDVTVGGEGVMYLPQVEAGHIEIDGAGHKFTGILNVSGGSSQTTPESVTIKNLNFVAIDGADTAIQAGEDNKSRYVHNLTVEGCTFTDPTGGLDCAAIREDTAGGKNWLIKNCTVDNTMHSMLQVKNVDGLKIENCTVESKNGMNLNATPAVEVVDGAFNVKGYALRFGPDGSGADAVLKDVQLKSECDGEAIIVFRGNAINSNSSVTLEGTTLEGTSLYAGIDDAQIIVK